MAEPIYTDLDLTNMPENFHPAATWMRVVVMTIALWSVGAIKPITFYFYEMIGGTGIVTMIFYILFCLGSIVTCVSARFERWFPRPNSTKTWAGRTSIGWNIHFCQIEQNAMKYIFRWRFSKGDIPMAILLPSLFFIEKSSFLMLFVVTPCMSAAVAVLWNDQMRRLADEAKETDSRIDALIY